jgi:hypothetical protein
MLAALIIFVPVALLVGFTVWAFYRCQKQTAVYLTRPARPAVKVEDYNLELVAEAEKAAVAAPPPCSQFLDRYFERGPMILGGTGGGWDLTRHLSQVRHRHRPAWEPPLEGPRGGVW